MSSLPVHRVSMSYEYSGPTAWQLLQCLSVNTISWDLARLRVKVLKVNADLKSGIKPKLHCTSALNYPFTTLIIHCFIPLSSCWKGFHLTNPSTVTSLLSSRTTQRTVYSEPYRFLFYLFTVCKQPTYQQAALVWACAAKRWWWLGEEMHGVWSWGFKTKGKTKEDLERGCSRGLSST